MTAAGLEELLAAHRPATTREAHSLAAVRRYVRWLARPLDEAADPVHVTASAVVLDDRGRSLLHRHRRLGLWLQPGGHVGPGEAPAAAAFREAVEETGIPLRHDDAGRLVHVDVHEGGRGHLHLDLRWLLHGDGTAGFAPAAGESQQLRWVPVAEIDAWGDASVADAVRAGAARLTRRG